MNDKLDDQIKFDGELKRIVLATQNNKTSPFKRGEFFKKTWERFDFKTNISALLSKDEPYFAHKQLVFAAFCAWLIAPANEGLRKSFVLTVVAEKLADIENDLIETSSESRFAMEIGKRIFQIGSDFFNEVYYPIGGLYALLRCPSPQITMEVLKKESKNVDRIVLMAQMLHFAATDLQGDGLLRRASKNIIVGAVDILAKERNIARGLGGRTAGPLWSEYEPTMLLLYAAHNVKTSPRPRMKIGNFIDAIVQKEASFEHDIELVLEICARALCLKSSFKKGIAQETMQILNKLEFPPVSPIETAREEFNYGKDVIDEAIIRKAILSAAANR